MNLCKITFNHRKNIQNKLSIDLIYFCILKQKMKELIAKMDFILIK